MADDSTKKPHRVTVRLGTKVVEQVEGIASHEDRSVSYVVRQLVKAGLAQRPPVRPQVRQPKPAP